MRRTTKLSSLPRSGRFPAVAAAVLEVLADVPTSPPLRRMLELLLARPRWCLAPTGSMTWPPYVYATCEALGGDTALAVWPAAAVELVVAAIDVADDLIDGEFADLSQREQGRLTNAATALAFLGQACLARVAHQLPPENAALLTRQLAAGAYASATGQDLDLLLESQPATSKQDALQVTERKSGSLGAMACAVGAAIATTDAHTLELVEAFGRHAGTSAQLLNDLDGVDLGSSKSDLRQRKKTLPVAYLLEEAERRTDGADLLALVKSWYSDDALRSTPDTERQLQTLLHDVGALQFTWIVADARRREGEAALQTLAEYTDRRQVLELRQLLASVKARRAG
jgi:geranylgeranyl pyrophosphate synthase